jgi:primosomal protein N'
MHSAHEEMMFFAPLGRHLQVADFKERREVVGIIVEVLQETDVPAEKLKDALAVRSQLAPLSPQWLALAGFAAEYYQRPLGEVACRACPRTCAC